MEGKEEAVEDDVEVEEEKNVLKLKKRNGIRGLRTKRVTERDADIHWREGAGRQLPR